MEQRHHGSKGSDPPSENTTVREGAKGTEVGGLVVTDFPKNLQLKEPTGLDPKAHHNDALAHVDSIASSKSGVRGGQRD